MTISTAAGAELYVSPTAGGAGTYYCVHQMHTLDTTHGGKNVDAAHMGITWGVTKQVTQNISFKGTGFFDYYGDTTGQKYIMDNAVNGGVCWIKYLYGTDDGGDKQWAKSQVQLTDFTIKTATTTMVEFNFSAEGTGDISFGVTAP